MEQRQIPMLEKRLKRGRLPSACNPRPAVKFCMQTMKGRALVSGRLICTASTPEKPCVLSRQGTLPCLCPSCSILGHVMALQLLPSLRLFDILVVKTFSIAVVSLCWELWTSRAELTGKQEGGLPGVETEYALMREG